MSLLIRPASPQDRPAMLILWQQAWTEVMPDIDFAARLPWIRERLDTLERSGAAVLVGVDEGGVRGFVTVDTAAEDMDQLAVSPQAQRCGVGRRLVQAAKARSPAGLNLKVNQRNLRAIRLYESERFAAVGEGVSAASGLPLWHMRWPGP